MSASGAKNKLHVAHISQYGVFFILSHEGTYGPYQTRAPFLTLLQHVHNPIRKMASHVQLGRLVDPVLVIVVERDIEQGEGAAETTRKIHTI